MKRAKDNERNNNQGMDHNSDASLTPPAEKGHPAVIHQTSFSPHSKQNHHTGDDQPQSQAHHHDHNPPPGHNHLAGHSQNSHNNGASYDQTPDHSHLTAHGHSHLTAHGHDHTRTHDHTRDHNHSGHGSAQSHHDHHHLESLRQRFWVSLILTVPVLLLSEMIQMWLGFRLTFPLQKYLLFALSAFIYFYGGWPFLTGALSELKQKLPGMMTLIATAITIAFLYSSATTFFIRGQDFFWELATLIVIMLLGHWLEARSVMGASRALEELVRIMPTVAHVLRNGQVNEVTDLPVSSLQKGDLVLVRPGEKIPSDGIVADGESLVNEALLTGESRPVPKATGDRVIGGSINGDGSLQVTIEKTGEETYLAQVISLVRQAQESRSRTQDLANRSAALLFYVALAAGLISFAIWAFIKGPDFALERAVSVLVIACPHALGLAIPLVVAISTSIAASQGILIRDRRVFEEVRNVQAVVFDKTGTLTEGQLAVAQVVTLKPDVPEDEFLRLTAGVEINSEHLMARAIVAYVQSRGLNPAAATDFKAFPGKGASAEINGQTVFVGGLNLLKELKLESELEDERLKALAGSGQTLVFTVVGGQVAGAVALNDRLKPESFEAVKRLKRLNVKVLMLTGDSELVAAQVAREAGIDNYFAGLLPPEKAEKIRLIKESGQKVAMVGDGINDAPALATADVGIAIGAGTDVAIESADLILIKNNPADIANIIQLSKKTFSKMIQNLWWAAGYNIIAIPLAAGLLYQQGIVISPALGAVLMSLSTVIVALNSQTLRRVKKGT